MEKIRCLIADDDPGMRLLLRKIIEKTDDFAVCAEAANGKEALEALDTKPQICFLDVEMPVLDGVACAHAIQDRDPRIPLIFATAHEQYMRDAFEVYAFDYLLKPFDVRRVRATLDRLRPLCLPQRVERRPVTEKKLMLASGETLCSVDESDVLLVQREERMTVIYTKKSRYTTADTLSEFAEKLDKTRFFRTHRSYIINVLEISSILPYGRWTYVIKLKGTDRDALITSERMEALEQMLKGMGVV